MWSGVRGRCHCGPELCRRQLRRCSAPWGAYSAAAWCRPHRSRVSCVQLSEGEKKAVKIRRCRGRRTDGGGSKNDSENAAAELTRFTLVVHMEVLGGAWTGVFPKQQVIDRQLTVPVALTLRQQLLQTKGNEP